MMSARSGPSASVIVSTLVLFPPSLHVVQITLRSGDALVFGGRARAMLHGVARILPTVELPPRSTCTTIEEITRRPTTRRKITVEERAERAQAGEMKSEGRIAEGGQCAQAHRTSALGERGTQRQRPEKLGNTGGFPLRQHEPSRVPVDSDHQARLELSALDCRLNINLRVH